MEVHDLSKCLRFAPEKMQKVSIFDSEHMFFDQYCLLPGQAQKIHAHATEDKVYVVQQGEVTFLIDGERETFGPGHAVPARAGVEHGVSNASDQEAVLLVVMAPKPG